MNPPDLRPFVPSGLKSRLVVWGFRLFLWLDRQHRRYKSWKKRAVNRIRAIPGDPNNDNDER